MSGRPKPSRAWPRGLLRNASAPAAPYPTAGSVIGMTIGRNPYFSSRKPLTSNHPSSPRNVDGAGVVLAGFSTDAGASASVCAPTGDTQRNSTVSTAIARRVITTAIIFHAMTGAKRRLVEGQRRVAGAGAGLSEG